jgi:hypothetical protein
MKPYKFILFLSLLSGIIIIGSCKKEAIQNDNSFIAVVETASNYSTRSCFQLSDGSYIILGIGDEEKPVMARFTETGDLIWQKQLPNTLAGVEKGIPLPSGGFVLAGSDSTWGTNTTAQSGITTVISYDVNGNPIHSVAINSIPNNGVENYIDFTLLKNGNLAFCLSPKPSLTYFTYPRLLILNQNLLTVFDQVYYTSTGLPFYDLTLPYIQEAKDGSIHFCFNSLGATTALMKLNPDYSFSYMKDSISNSSELPGSFALDADGNCCIATSRQVMQYAYFYYEEISFGYEVSIIRTDTAGNYVDRHDYSGFTGLGALMKIIRTRDGGFIMVGTSNHNERITNVANTQIFLMKTDAQLNKQWMKQFNPTYPAVGYDVFETRDGGYAIGAFERSFNKYFKMMIIKTDANGN